MCTTLYLLLQSMTLADAQKMALEILKQVMEEKISDTNVELATVTAEDGYKLFDKEALSGLLASL